MDNPISPKILNNVVWITVPLTMMVLYVLMHRCQVDTQYSVRHPFTPRAMDRYCVLFGKHYVPPSIHSVGKTFLKSVLTSIAIYMYLSLSPVDATSWTTFKYIIGLVVIHDYLGTLFDNIVGLDIMFFPYELYYVGIFMICWLLFHR